jgi:hypothetical protein
MGPHLYVLVELKLSLDNSKLQFYYFKILKGKYNYFKCDLSSFVAIVDL